MKAYSNRKQAVERLHANHKGQLFSEHWYKHGDLVWVQGNFPNYGAYCQWSQSQGYRKGNVLIN